jgi:putative tryptophan/tyrosine transport system substrate-binding protein
MNRREVILALGGVAAAPTMFGPLAARAQQRTMPVVGILSMQTRESETVQLAGIRQGLKEAGLVEGRNVTIEYRFADGQRDRLPMLAAELVRRPVDVLLANTTPPALAAKAATTTVPIVFALGVDPVAWGLVASLNRPGANVTGVTFLVQQLVGKRLELLCEVVPKTAAIGMVSDQSNPNAEGDVKNALAAAAALGRTLHVANVAAQSDIDAAFAALVAQQVAAVFVAPHANFRIWRERVLALAARHALRRASLTAISSRSAG